MRFYIDTFSRWRRPAALLALALSVSACATKTSVSSKWIDKARGNAPYNAVLVVGVSANTESRLSFEQAVAEDLRSDVVAAWASANLMPGDQEITEPVLFEVATKQGANGIIVTRVTNMEIKPVEIGGRSTVLAEQQQSGIDHTYRRKQGTLFQYDYEEDVEATYMTTEYTTELQTDVYEAASGKRVYTLKSATAKQETLAEVIKVLSDEIAKRLRRDKVIQ